MGLLKDFFVWFRLCEERSEKSLECGRLCNCRQCEELEIYFFSIVQYQPQHLFTRDILSLNRITEKSSTLNTWLCTHCHYSLVRGNFLKKCQTKIYFSDINFYLWNHRRKLVSIKNSQPHPRTWHFTKKTPYAIRVLLMEIHSNI